MIRRSSVFVFLLFLASATQAEWKKIAPGAHYQKFESGTLHAYVTKVDLTHSALRITSTSEDHKGTTVSEFARRNHAIVAINGDYFDDKLEPVGLAVGPCGRWKSTRDTRREGFVAVGKKKAEIYKQSSVIDPPPSWIESAVSGWPLIVRGCQALTSKELPGSDPFTRAPHPRTAVGLSKNRKTLYLVVADGRNEKTPGLTLASLAKFMDEDLGVCTALNLDGGGSSTMFVGGEVVNRPSDGAERKVSNHLGVVLASEYEGCDAKVAIRK